MSSKPVSLSHHIGNGFVAKLVNIEPLAIPSLAPPPLPPVPDRTVPSRDRGTSHRAAPSSANLFAHHFLSRFTLHASSAASHRVA